MTPADRLATASAALTAAYRAQRGTCLTDMAAPAAYVVARMPATFAAVRAALAEAAERVDCRPKSLIDLGTGPGTVAWAAADLFETLEQAVLIDREEAMIGLGRKLAEQGPPALARARWLKADLPTALDGASADLVTAAYALNELPAPEVPRLARAMAEAASELVVIVEPGTPQGFAVIRAARQALIEAGLKVAAPCPGEGACPMMASEFCRFAVRLARSKSHRAAKAGLRGFEDEPYSYVVAARPGIAVASAPARIVAPPVALKPHVDLTLCAPSGKVSARIPTRDAERSRLARRLAWGDALPWSP